jgi:MoaA/NifB/PqqE/SkfB family radical SAM enzyme
MAFGGEPMLHPGLATTIFQKASDLKIPQIEMLTNGVWGKNREHAEGLAVKLEKAGLNHVGVSVDAFHSRYIPLKYPRNAALALLKAGVKNVTWNVTVAESIDAANEYDQKTRQILRTLEPVGIEVHIHKIISVGRAIQNLRNYFQPTPIEGSCEGESTIGNVLTNPESICIEPSGEVDVCWYLAIGNAREKPLSQIISEYDWRKNPTIKILVEKGPTGLLEFAEERSHRFQKDQYINKCHLCTEIRKSLRFQSQTQEIERIGL